MEHEGWPRGSQRILITACLSQTFGATHSILPPSPNTHLSHKADLLIRPLATCQLGGDAYTNDKEWHLVMTFSLANMSEDLIWIPPPCQALTLERSCSLGTHSLDLLRDTFSSNLYTISIFLEKYYTEEDSKNWKHRL